MSSCTLELSPTRAPAERRLSSEFEAWPFRELLAPDFKVERRRGERWDVPGVATLLALGKGLGAVLELHSLTGSPWWLSGRCSVEKIGLIPVGTLVSVGFSSPEGRPAHGVIERCTQVADGDFAVAIRFTGGNFQS
jgi:hypothetical protein